MCGICGIAGKNDSELVKAMTGRMVHRGPDSEGFYSDDDVALGMRRLKIIDLNTGDQPMHNEDKSVWIIFNGEIYNFKELRNDLVQRGHSFYTQSDTEVIVHLYEEYQESCVNFLRGMFVFAIWDKREKRLLLTRDRVGIKPLYYSYQNQQLIFASEISALVESAGVSRQINFAALDYYLTFLYIPAPLTIYEGINKLLPGHTLSFQNGKIEIRQYWQLTVVQEPLQTEEYYVERIRQLLNEVVGMHMVSDVPLGAFLSGGLDSSCMVGLMSKLVKRPIKTFSIGFEERYSSYNELEYSRQIAKLFKCDHHEFILKPKIAETISQVVNFIDEPFADSSAILNFLICKEARQFVTVALSGIGGDEVFGGYPRYLAALSTPTYQNLPTLVRWWLQKLPFLISESTKSGDLGGRLKRYLSSSNLSIEEKYIFWISYFDYGSKNKLYSDRLKASLGGRKNYVHFDYFLATKDRNFPDRVNFLDIKTYLPDDLLIMADRMSMANSLELRVPLCDHKLIEFVSGIPLSLRLKGFKLKSLFKEAIRDLLPANIIHKRKQGFMIPLADWLREDLQDYVREVLSEANIKKRGLFNAKEVRVLIDNHFKGRKFSTHKIWALLILELWLNHSLEKHRMDYSYSLKAMKFQDILIVTEVFFPDLIGGAGKYVHALSLGLIGRGHKVRVITRHLGNLPREEERQGMKIFRAAWKGTFILFRPLNFLWQMPTLLKKIKNQQAFDLIIFNQPFSTFCAKLSKEIGNAKTVYNFHSSWVDEFQIMRGIKDVPWYSLGKAIKQWFYKPLLFLMAKMERCALNQVEKIIVLSQFSRDRIIELYNIPADKIEIIPPAIETDKFIPNPDKNNLRRKFNLPEDDFILFTARNLVPRMGIDNLIIAFAEIAQKYPEVYLIIAGAGFLEKRLKKLAKKLNLTERINFVGSVKQEVLYNYYQLADLFILPTRYLEGFGLVTLEAMASGLPVLGTPVGGTTEILSKFDKNFLFSGVDPQSMAKKISEFLNSKPDLVRLGLRCREFVLQEYSQEKWLDRIESFLSAVDNGRK